MKTATQNIELLQNLILIAIVRTILTRILKLCTHNSKSQRAPVFGKLFAITVRTCAAKIYTKFVIFGRQTILVVNSKLSLDNESGLLVHLVSQAWFLIMLMSRISIHVNNISNLCLPTKKAQIINV